ncbi:insulinase family protein [Streptomyces coeruleorubidus]|uniref:M16 family metallopeptidase n=1 Tax=Streptomyces coeruleorubidus TaxID=116188 RepID=UPI00237F7B78|nr:insulinase family protein [Streptomyces coeruleorubidus]WDV51845.1 insulinase family protein [Streptomyces coeruleorubidus]
MLLAPNPVGASIGVAVHYNVGFRTEPEGRTGLAHLFEHLMFQGGRGAAPVGYLPQVQRAGGFGDARTRQDVTVYYAAAPASALEMLLTLEVDRMRAPFISARNLRTQTAVIDEEIRLMVRNRPYGTFPWVLPRALHRRAENARDGYGETVDLASFDIPLCERFFADHYGPGNAVVTLTGAFDRGVAERLVRRHFEDLPARETVRSPDLHEPLPGEERRLTVGDPHAGSPAVAVGYRMPDPVTERADYLAHLVLAALLGQGRQALLRRGPTAASEAASLSVGCGLFGLPLDTAGPDLLTLFAVHEHERGAEHILDALDATLEALATDEIAAGPLRATTARWAAGAMRELGDPGTRAQLLGLRETLFGEAELTQALPELVRGGVTGEQVSRAAARLRSSHRAVVHFVPGQAVPRGAAREMTA